MLFTICFFPWLKITGDETPAARSPAWSRKERGEETRLCSLLQRGELGSPLRLGPSRAQRRPFSSSPGQGPGRLAGAWGWGRAAGASRHKALHTGPVKSRAPLPNTGDYIQCPEINRNGKEYERSHVCVCIYIYTYIYIHTQLSHFSVQQKLIRHCQSIIDTYK